MFTAYTGSGSMPERDCPDVEPGVCHRRLWRISEQRLVQAPDRLGPVDQLAAGGDDGIRLVQRGHADHVAVVRSLAPRAARRGPAARPPVHGHRSWSRRRHLRPLSCGSEQHRGGTDTVRQADPPTRTAPALDTCLTGTSRPVAAFSTLSCGQPGRATPMPGPDYEGRRTNLSKPRGPGTLPLLRTSAGLQRRHPRGSSALVGASIHQVGIRGAPNDFPPGRRSRPWPRP